MKNKKSFVLYADLDHTVSKLPDDKAGALFKLILEYVNDKSPEVDEDDLLLQVVFEPIKQQLKRDLQKWDKIKQARSEAGKKGGRPPKAKKANALFDKQGKAKKAVNDNVNVNVNVTDNVNVNVTDNVIKKNKRDKKIIYPYETEKFFKAWELWKQYKKEQHNFKYKGAISEQAALKKIGELSAGSEAVAIAIINQSIDNSWAGLFNLKNQKNGSKKSNSLEIPDEIRDSETFRKL